MAKRKRKGARPHGIGIAHNESAVHSDVLGSYTGKPLEGAAPVQDADDL